MNENIFYSVTDSTNEWTPNTIWVAGDSNNDLVTYTPLSIPVPGSYSAPLVASIQHNNAVVATLTTPIPVVKTPGATCELQVSTPITPGLKLEHEWGDAMPSFLVLSNFDAARGPIDETRYSMTCCNLPPCTIEITDYKYRTDTAPTP